MEVQNGVLLCKILDRIEPGVIDWTKVRDQPKNVYEQNNNQDQFLSAAREKVKLKLIGVQSAAITKGDKKDVCACLWILCSYSFKKLVKNLEEPQIVEWANNAVGSNHAPIKNFTDKALSDGRFLMHVLASIEPRCINWDIMMEGDSDEAKKNNAMYVISVARMLHACVFCVWDQIASVHKKSMYILVTTLMDLKSTYVAPKE